MVWENNRLVVAGSKLGRLARHAIHTVSFRPWSRTQSGSTCAFQFHYLLLLASRHRPRIRVLPFPRRVSGSPIFSHLPRGHIGRVHVRTHRAAHRPACAAGVAGLVPAATHQTVWPVGQHPVAGRIRERVSRHLQSRFPRQHHARGHHTLESVHRDQSDAARYESVIAPLAVRRAWLGRSSRCTIQSSQR